MKKTTKESNPTSEVLTDKERRGGQRYALLHNLFLQTINFIVVGQYLQLYASDVLGLEPTRIAARRSGKPLSSLSDASDRRTASNRSADDTG